MLKDTELSQVISSHNRVTKEPPPNRVDFLVEGTTHTPFNQWCDQALHVCDPSIFLLAYQVGLACYRISSRPLNCLFLSRLCLLETQTRTHHVRLLSKGMSLERKDSSLPPTIPGATKVFQKRLKFS